ncbi:SDR family oxidoreductase [Pontibacter sp. BT310]|uniref:SDR family oxidoreductase n=1 Tax=Pontibacter populi TaxID=890055 RepID=A0ABS6XE95_9BACT|nr:MULTISPECIES: SDR family oxidoreductase [Pontibacter]MBJ6119140.1 SDR family oxidoreductase [Pontibacter sp. BT310]MBR0571568.1 SDR family oxidoreductase [Microvirga sp. STS03]MBW3365994.1 SDR family oxidoreductase [Pontibacter populi]
MKTDEQQQSKGVVVVTGASAGLGRCIAREFASNGYDVALLARGEDGLKGAKSEVEAMGRRAAYFIVDVADAAAVEHAAEETEKQLGPITVWVNNAMNSVFSPIKEMQPEEYKRVTEVTYLGQVYGTLSALKRMLPRNKGVIVLVGSALAYRGIPLQSAYCGSKHAIQGFFDSLRSELLHDKTNVRATMVQLPAMNTTQFMFVKTRLPNKPKPMGKIYQPEVAARAIVYAAENERREVYVGYPTVQAIVGDKIAPEIGDWVLAKTGFDGQQTNIPEDPNRPNNLWAPIPGDHGAHGTFDAEATYDSLQLWLSMHKKDILTTAAALGGFLLGSMALKKWFGNGEND